MIMKQSIIKEHPTATGAVINKVALIVFLLLTLSACGPGDPKELYEQAVRIFNGVKYEEKLLNTKIDSEHSPESPSDVEQAVELYRKAADQGLAAAQTQLGICYFEGIGVEKDYDEAVRLFNLAANQNDPDAYFMLSRYFNFEQDHDKIFEKAKKSADLHSAMGEFGLAECYQLGIGVKKDDSQADYWYEKAAEKGLMPAQVVFADRFFSNNNYAKALYWFEKAADQGCAYAAMMAGDLYLHQTDVYDVYYRLTGKGKKRVREIPKDAEKGLALLHKAADCDYAPAKYCLASYHYLKYLKNDNIQSLKEAEKWMNEAAQQHLEIAVEMLPQVQTILRQNGY